MKSQIGAACSRCGRDPKDIVLIGVTKYTDAQSIREGVEAGLTDIGENRVQDAKAKFDELTDIQGQFTRHLIGHLQTNKVKVALDYFDLIQSVDSLKLVKEIQKQAENKEKVVRILVQVNTSGESQKFGAESGAALDLVAEIAKMPNILVEGLMTIGPLVDDERILRACFSDLRRISENLTRSFIGSEKIKMKYLSMGMTNDFGIAIEEGANMIRVGRAIFS